MLNSAAYSINALVIVTMMGYFLLKEEFLSKKKTVDGFSDGFSDLGKSEV